MRIRRHIFSFFLIFLLGSNLGLFAQSSSSSSPPSSSSRSSQKSHKTAEPEIDAGAVINSTYSNKAFGITCKIPAGWVLRTDEMNAPDEDDAESAKAQSQSAPRSTETGSGRVLLAAFSRPPGATGAEVNSSIVIAAESAKTYPGLTDAAQYLGPVTEVAKAQGFQVIEEPYEFAVGAKTVARSDFQKDVGSRMMRQSTLVLLARGWVISFTFLGANEDEVEDLVERLSFAGGAKPAAK
jgi:hypothetical protein